MIFKISSFLTLALALSSLDAVTAVSVARQTAVSRTRDFFIGLNLILAAILIRSEYSFIYSAPLCCNLAQIQSLIR